MYSNSLPASFGSGHCRVIDENFRAMLRSPDPLIRAFRHFLSEHVRFDSDPDEGHGALIRHRRPDDRVLPLWFGFKNILLACVPALKREPPDGVEESDELLMTVLLHATANDAAV
jgi:hypothetical protein